MFISAMNTLYLLFAFVFAFSQRSDASYPFAFHGYSPYYPYIGAIHGPGPVLHAAPSFYPYYPMAYHHPHRELHNVAGAIQQENELLTDVSMRFPAKKTHKNL